VNKKVNQEILRAEILAYQGKYQESASAFIKASKTEEAINLFCDLKRFDDAVRYLKMGGNTLENKSIM
jgi:intraflagellar transport protein 122